MHIRGRHKTHCPRHFCSEGSFAELCYNDGDFALTVMKMHKETILLLSLEFHWKAIYQLMA